MTNSSGANQKLVAENQKLTRQIEKLARISDRLQAQHTQTLNEFNDQLKEQVRLEVEKRLQVERQRELEQALLMQQSKSAELGHMIGGITHQWKQPLNAIGLIAQDLIEEMDEKLLNPPLLAKRVEEIMGQLQFMSQTIDDFHNLYKPSRSQVEFSPAEAIESVVALLRTQLISSHIEVELNLDASTLTSGWPNEFKQVILSLITNAKDAFEENNTPSRRLVFTQHNEERSIQITLSDNAGGIDPSLLPDKLFEPYASTKKQGTGIGLSMARAILERVGGSLEAKNGPEGALFTLSVVRFGG